MNEPLIETPKTPERDAAEARALLARLAGVSDARNTHGFVSHSIARLQWLRASRAEAERRRRAALEARPERLALLKRAAEKRARKASRRAAEAYAL